MLPDFRKAPRTAWPSPSDEMLLKAALLQGEDARRALLAWENSVTLDDVSFGAFRLLPLLHHNLVQNGIVARDARRLAGVARRAWAENQLTITRTAGALKGLAEAGIAVMLLKGLPLLLHVYRNPSLRTLGDVDILVRPEDVPAALNWLQKEELRIKDGPMPADPIAATTGINFLAPNGLDLDLHWSMLFNRPEPDYTRPFWESAVQIEVNGQFALRPSWADLFLTACLQGFRWDVVVPLRWVADAWWMLASPQEEMDWDRVAWQAKRLEQTLVMRTALRYLRDTFGAQIPSNVFRSLGKAAVTGYERLEKYVFLRRPLPVFGFSLVKYLTERRLPRYHGGGMVSYLKDLWGVKNGLHLVPEAIRRAARQLLRSVGGGPASS